jgi:hypothetical protein
MESQRLLPSVGGVKRRAWSVFGRVFASLSRDVLADLAGLLRLDLSFEMAFMLADETFRITPGTLPFKTIIAAHLLPNPRGERENIYHWLRNRMTAREIIRP